MNNFIVVAQLHCE